MPRKDPQARKSYEKWRNKQPHRKRADSIRHRNSYLNDPNIIRRRRADHLRRSYGITIEEYDTMLTTQHGVCAICHKPERGTFKNKYVATGKPKRLAVDHDHKTKKIRGLLCEWCNKSLGLMEESPERLLAAAIYLEKYKCQ